MNVHPLTVFILLSGLFPKSDDVLNIVPNGGSELLNSNCRAGTYPSTNIERAVFDENHLRFDMAEDISYYKPKQVHHRRRLIKMAAWMISLGFTELPTDFDQEQINYINAIEWNGVSHGLDRRSFHGEYLTEWLPLMELDYRSVLIPLNIIGRTGIVGRGLLDEFGPNKCVDVVLLRPRRRRVKRNATDIPVWIPCRDGQGRVIYEVLVIVRGDSKEIALPGGKVDPYEHPLRTAYRELFEETKLRCNDAASDEDNIAKLREILDFITIYEGNNNDWRDTDNAWMETTAKLAVIKSLEHEIYSMMFGRIWTPEEDPPVELDEDFDFDSVESLRQELKRFAGVVKRRIWNNEKGGDLGKARASKEKKRQDCRSAKNKTEKKSSKKDDTVYERKDGIDEWYNVTPGERRTEPRVEISETKIEERAAAVEKYYTVKGRPIIKTKNDEKKGLKEVEKGKGKGKEPERAPGNDPESDDPYNGNEADKVFWCPVNRHIPMYGNHRNILKRAVKRLDGHW